MCTEKLVRTLLFVVDTSLNMIGDGINTVNDAIRKVIEHIRNYLDSEQNTVVRISVLESSDASGYRMSELEPIIAGYTWKDINATDSDAKISEAFKKIDEKLSNDKSIDAYDGTPNLGIVLIVSQKFDENWEVCLNNLFCNKNKKFGHSIRSAVVFGDESNSKCPTKLSLLRFTSVKRYDDLTDEPVTNDDGTYKHDNNEVAVAYRNYVDGFREAIIQESISVVNMLFSINETQQELLYE